MPAETLTAPLAPPNCGAASPVIYRGGGFQPTERPWLAAVAVALLLAIWQTASSLGWVNSLFLPSPLAIAQALRDSIVDGQLWLNLEASLFRIGVGWLIGTAAGLVLGLAIGLYSMARSIGMPIVSALFPIPKIAILPLLILWFGIGEPSKVATIALGVVFPTIISAASGVDSVPRNLIRMAQSFNLPFRAIVTQIVLPGAMPSILAGFRISVSTALILVVSAEMIGAERGIGAFVLSAGNLMQTDQLMAGVVVLSALGILFGVVLSRFERRLGLWR